MNEIKDLSVEIKLNSVDYLASVSVEQHGLGGDGGAGDDEEEETATGGQRLVLELDELGTASQWRGVFEADYLEDLTRRTGNFKAFPIFVNMLQTALKQESKSLSLDLLTFSDLEMLRNKKANVSASSVNKPSGAGAGQSATTSNNNNKRVLILTYNVEFDRINYPLQLGFQGRRDPVELLHTIKELKTRLSDFERQDTTGQIAQGASNKELLKLQRENERLKREKEIIEMEFFKFKTMVEGKLKGGKCELGDKSDKSVATMAKEVKLLKQMIKTLEESALKEKTGYQKQLLKKKEEINQLNDELFRLKSNERNLALQLKAFNNEAALTHTRQRSRDHSRDSQYRSTARPSGHARVSSVESARRRTLPAPAYPGTTVRSRNNSPGLNRNSSAPRGRSSSAGRRPDSATGGGVVKRYSNPTGSSTSLSRLSSLNNSSDSIGSNRSSSRKPLFNPTEFVKNKALRQREIDAQRKKGISTQRPPSRTRTPSTGSLNGYESDRMSTYSQRSETRNQCQLIGRILNDADGLDHSSQVERKHRTSLATNQTASFNASRFDRTDEFSEIDHKLKSLELLIKNSL